ncbi:MAG: VWA domain-containing protein [Deltaproteobacteria bacterium]|nr:VWA domain-containing protein [Deltaproteobacteria bacterium]
MRANNVFGVVAVAVLAVAGMIGYSGCGGSGNAGNGEPQDGGGGAAADGGGVKGGAAGKGGGNADGSAASSGSAAKGGSAAWDANVDDTGDVFFPYDAPLQDNSVNADSACAATTAEVKPVPLDMYLMQDKTGSMNEPQSTQGNQGDCNVGQNVNSKWCHAINAIAGFVQAPTSVGMGVALNFFSGSQGCNGAQYATPSVALGLLPANVQPLIDALNAAVPTGMTPTEGAIRGLNTFTAANVAPPRVMIGILITDGDPTACDEDVGNLAGLISAHFSATGIRTFVIGMNGATFGNLETWAVAGGGPAHANFCDTGVNNCHYYNVGDGDPQAFIQALQQIQQSAVACQFSMPTADGGLVDPAKVLIEYLPGGAPPAQQFTRVNDAAACVAGGFYYDNNANPSTIILCPATCATVQADPAAKVQVLLGCQGS